MEFIDGMSLARLVAEQGPLPVRKRVSGAPEGWSTRNVIRSGRPAATLGSLKPAN